MREDTTDCAAATARDEELHRWQREALDAWIAAGCRGVVQATTGAGKTRLAIAAIESIREMHESVCVAVVVPTVLLAKQWHASLGRNRVGLNYGIGHVHSAAGGDDWRGQPIAIFVINSARDGLARVNKLWGALYPGAPVLLIVDECHRAASDHNAQVFDVPVAYAIGLSATPERPDGRHESHIYPALGPVVYRYGLRDAMNDAVVADVRAVNLYVKFNRTEQARWIELEQKSARLSSVVLAHGETVSRSRLAKLAQRDATAARLLDVLSQQEDMIDTCKRRIACERDVIDWIEQSDERTIVFNERIDNALLVRDELGRRGVSAAIDHSELNDASRVQTLADLESGEARVLVAVRSLDEGIDIPDARVAVILSGGRTLRQRVQRVGRVARRAHGKDSALVITVLALSSPEAPIVGRRDQQVFGSGRVTHHRWPETRVVAAVSATENTMDVTALQVQPGGAIVAFLGLESAVPAVQPAQLGRAARALRDVCEAVSGGNVNGYREAVVRATKALVDAGGDEEASWAASDSLPGAFPNFAIHTLTKRQVLKSLNSAQGLLRSVKKANMTRALGHLRRANEELCQASEVERQLEEDLEEHEVRERLANMVRAAERLADKGGVDAARELGRIRKRWRDERDDLYLSDPREYRALRERLDGATVLVLEGVVRSAEAAAGRIDSGSCRALGEARRAWRQADASGASLHRGKLRERLRLATRCTLLAIVEVAESAADEPGDDSELGVDRLRKRWKECGGAFDAEMHQGLGRRFDEAIALSTRYPE